jgi:hypothetical protein
MPAAIQAMREAGQATSETDLELIQASLESYLSCTMSGDGWLQTQDRTFGIVSEYLSPGKESEAQLAGIVRSGVNDFSHVAAPT